MNFAKFSRPPILQKITERLLLTLLGLTLFLPTFSVHVSGLDLPVNATLPGSALTLQIFKNASSFLQVLQDSRKSELFVEKLKVTKILTKFSSQF